MSNEQQASLSNEQIAQAAAAGVNLLQRESTLVPGSIKQQVAVLEMVLTAIAQGRLMVVSVPETPVESGSDIAGEITRKDIADLTGEADAEGQTKEG